MCLDNEKAEVRKADWEDDELVDLAMVMFIVTSFCFSSHCHVLFFLHLVSRVLVWSPYILLLLPIVNWSSIVPYKGMRLHFSLVVSTFNA